MFALFDWIKSILTFLTFLLPLLGLTGCTGIFHPVTSIEYGPFKLVNGKDVTVEVEDASYDPATGGFKVGRLRFLDTASDVRAANAIQMYEVNRQLETHGRNIERVGSIVSAALPFMSNLPAPQSGPTNFTTPWGDFSMGKNGPDLTAWQAYLDALRAQRSAAPVIPLPPPAPTSQPSQ